MVDPTIGTPSGTETRVVDTASRVSSDTVIVLEISTLSDAGLDKPRIVCRAASGKKWAASQESS